MPRVQALDYSDKRNMILDAAALLFAEHGYAGCKMDDIASECGVSKSMLYHYFSSKEDVLYEILQTHLISLIEAFQGFKFNIAKSGTQEYFRKFVEIYLEKSNTSRARHVVALYDMRYLTESQQKEQKRLERMVLDIIVEILQKITPNLPLNDYRLFALLLVGMMNWAELWYGRSGPVSPPEFYAKIASLFLDGFMNRDPGAEKPT